MGEHSKIEWTDHTFNPWIGCQKVSPGCDHCYAETLMDSRLKRVRWGPHGERQRTSPANWRKPREWAKSARALRYPRQRVFCASLADVFDNKVPPEWRADLFQLIRETPELDWLLLTKRPENMAKMLPEDWGNGYPNVWLGVTAEDHENYRRRYGILSATPAAVRFISCEPMLDYVRIDWVPSPRVYKPHWIICGGESGTGARMVGDPRWEHMARMLRDHCAQYEIPFFLKQMPGKKPIPEDLLIREFPNVFPAPALPA